MNLKRNNFKEKILDQIKSGRVKMRPRYYFFIRAALGILSMLLVLFLVVYLISFIMFIMKVQGIWYLPNFGLSGLYRFLLAFPWFLVGIALVFVLLLELFIKKVKLVYRKPLLYSVLGVALFSVAAGFILAEAPFHKRIFEKAREDEFPIIGPMYRGYGHRQLSNIYHGRVIELFDDQLKINTIRGEEFIVEVLPTTEVHGYDTLEVGDNIIVVGERDDGHIKAWGIKVLPGEKSYFPKGRPKHLDFFQNVYPRSLRHYLD